ncbi:amino acid adenylation domain-containing protein [Nocardia takedensis]|uniref:amino acid adenylation domain-containing protein n=1 Tax=Nocardia takedensis TaxID=259390 RepID=UPI003F75771C
MAEDTITHASDLHAAFAARAARHPDRTAVISGGDRLTYTELAELVDTIAGGLRALAAPNGERGIVALVLDRSIQFVATVLGTVAAGLTYAPIDPNAPTDYIEDRLTQLHPLLVITADPTQTQRAASPRRVGFDELLRGAHQVPLGVARDPEDPAYVLFTSGSTGVPKGVVVAHRAMLNSTRARLDRYGVPERIALLHSTGFDVSSGVLFYALLGGGTLVVNPAPLHDVATTVEVIGRERITHLVYAASLYPALLERLTADPPRSLAKVMIGSERWSEVLIDRHVRLLPTTSLYNEYGPTEACVFSSCALVYCGRTARRFALTLGRPLLDTGYILLDPGSLPVAPMSGRTGELAVTGANLALGYLDRPELTAQRFIRLPSGERAYRTGDLVEVTDGGEYLFRGRIDRQIKVGGNRVEPGHVETTLMTHPDVEQAHVCLHTAEGAVDSVLVGYLVPAADAAITPAAAREYVADRLPRYMVPTAWVVVTALARTTNGKIDERSLPRPLSSASAPGANAPADEVEQVLLGLVADGGAIEVAGVDADLSGVGLSSLAYVRISATISAHFGVEIAMSELFAAANVAEIAALVRRATPSPRPALTVTGRESDTAPFSAQQRQIWMLHHLAPSALAYTTQCTLELVGALDTDALGRALEAIVARHEILRTTFHDSTDGPVQRIHAPWKVHLEHTDLTGLDARAQHSAVTERKRAAMNTGFDIAALPLVRWYLLRLSTTRWQLFQVEHHFVHDGWSATLLLGEIRDLYAAELRGERGRLPALPVQYRDYAHWYHRWRDTEHYRRQQRYWVDTLTGCPPVGVSLEPDRARPAVQSFEGGCVRMTVPAAALREIDAVCAVAGVSRFAVFLSAFALLVWRHTGEADMVIGSALSNRRQPETADLLGMFVNALPLRLRVTPDSTLGALVAEVMEVLLGAQDHQEFPLVDLIEELDVIRDRARNALFGLMFAFHDTPRPRFALDGLNGELHIDHNGSAKNDVNVVCVPQPSSTDATGEPRGGMDILWEYDSALFDPATARAHATQFIHIVTALSSHWDTPIAAVDLLGPSMTRRILSAATGPASTPEFATITDGVDHSIARNPHDIALIHRSQRLTYRELDAMVARTESVLDRLALPAGSRVALAYPKSAELVAAWLAVLRRSLSYVTLDPDQPPARLRALVSDSAVAAILCPTDTAQTFDGCGVPLAGVPATATEPGGSRQCPRPKPGSAAYLTFTSGSTGTPKAVVASHANVVAAIHARTVEFGHEPPRTLITLPAIFDVAASMVMWTLWRGGAVVLPDDQTSERDPDALRALITEHAVTHVNFVSSFYTVLLESLDTVWPTSLRVVAIGGEPCTPGLVRAHARILHGVSLFNEYGPTETTVWCSVARVHPRADSREDSRVTIGRPVANAEMYVLDARAELAPVGARGELVVAGAGVAAGYAGHPALTSSRFGPLPVATRPGQWAYRTGDLARLRADGEVEVLGRRDDQVKIRGFRIETGEVARALEAHPGVSAVFVTAETSGATAQLAAFVAAPGHDHRLIPALRGRLAEVLPAYMQPSLYAVLDELPLTRVGKIDRTLLPTPLPPPTSAEEGGPGNAVQRMLLEQWRNLLDRADIGLDDDFFAVGGDSLLVIRAVTLARAHGVALSVPAVVRARSIRAITREQSLYCTVTDRPRRPGGQPVALSGIQGWFFAQNFAQPDRFAQARMFEIAEDTDELALLAAIEATVARHDAFRTAFTQEAGQWHARLLDAAATPCVEFVALDAEDVTAALEARLTDMVAQLSIPGRRLWRIAVCNHPWSGRHWLCLVAHHLIIDAVSWDIVIRDIETAYRTRTDPDSQPSPSPSPSPATVAAGMPEHLPYTADAAEIDYWTTLSDTPISSLALPASTEATPFGRMHRWESRLSPRARRLLVGELPRWGGPHARSVLLAALARGLEQAGVGPLFVMVEGHGRDGVQDAEQIVGWLTALYPLLAPATAGTDLLAAARTVQQHLARVPAHGVHYGIARYLEPASPLGKVVNEIAEPRVSFNYLGRGPAEMPTDVLIPTSVGTGAGIGAANVLPSPLDITVVDNGEQMLLRCVLDPARVSQRDGEAAVAAMVEAIEETAAAIPLTVEPGRPHHFLVHPVEGTIGWAHPLTTRPDSPWSWIGLSQSTPTTDTTVMSLAAEYCARLRRLQPQGPYTITGWSFGAAVAFEMARLFEQRGDRVAALTLIDPPRTCDNPDGDASLIPQLRHLLAWLTAGQIDELVTATEMLTGTQRVHAMIERIAAVDHAGQDLGLLAEQIAALLANRRALAMWRPSGPLVSFTVIASRHTLDARPQDLRDWEEFSRGPMRVEVVAGNHFSITSGEGLAAVGDLLDEPGR